VDDLTRSFLSVSESKRVHLTPHPTFLYIIIKPINHSSFIFFFFFFFSFNLSLLWQIQRETPPPFKNQAVYKNELHLPYKSTAPSNGTSPSLSYLPYHLLHHLNCQIQDRLKDSPPSRRKSSSRSKTGSTQLLLSAMNKLLWCHLGYDDNDENDFIFVGKVFYLFFTLGFMLCYITLCVSLSIYFLDLKLFPIFFPFFMLFL